MAKHLSVNYTDTPVSGGTTPNITVPALNYGADFRVIADEPSEVKLTNLTSPLDQPEKLRFAFNNVADVYRNAGIDPTVYYNSRRGVQLLSQLTDVYAVTDDADAGYLALLPIECHVVLKVPSCDLITAEVARKVVGRTVAGLFDASSTDVDSRLKSMLRGALMPSHL